MNVLMIGGTGYLGYFAVDELVKAGHRVTVVGLPPAPSADYFNGHPVQIELVDIATLDDAGLERLLAGHHAVVFAGGADGRNRFPAPAINGFREANVEQTSRLARLARNVGVGKLVILGSYYTAAARTFAEVDIVGPNPYIRSREEQTEAAFRAAGPDMDVIVLELPYIFGAAPGKGTLWGFYIDHVQKYDVVPVPAGGTACITARQVGQAIAGACRDHVRAQLRIPLADSNHDYRAIYGMFCEALGISRTFVARSIEQSLANARAQRAAMAASSVEGAYDPVSMVHLLDMSLYLDPGVGMDLLGFAKADMRTAIRETVEATIKYA